MWGFILLIQQWRTIRMQADDEDYELKQMKDMTAARKRWEALVNSIAPMN